MATKSYGVAATQPAGEQLLLFTGTIQGTTADWEPVTLVNSDGSLVETAGLKVQGFPADQLVHLAGAQAVTGTFWQATQPVSMAAQQLSTDTVTFSASGDNTIHTTTGGKTLQLYYLKLSSDGGNGPTVLAASRIGASTKVDLTSLAPSQVVAANIGAEFGGGAAYVAGAVGDNLIVNLSGAATVYATLRYLEV